METLRIIAINGRWSVQTDDPRTIAIMGSNIIPTPWSTATPLDVVAERLARLNPNSRIVKVSQVQSAF